MDCATAILDMENVDYRRILEVLKRRLAEVIVRSKINFRDDLRLLNVLWNRFGIERIACAKDILPFWKQFLESGKWGNACFSLYAHVPFCRKKCSFCRFNVRVGPTEGVLSSYVDDLIQEMEFFSGALSAITFSSFMVGGGTPSVLTIEQMRRLFSAAARLFNIHREKNGYQSIEFHPADASLEKLLVAREAGFDRVSFGVQSLDRTVLKRIYRDDQTTDHVRLAIRRSRKAGFGCVSVDLVLGLWGDSPDIFMRSAIKLLEEKPTNLCVNQLNLTQDYMIAEGIKPASYFSQRDEMISSVCESLKREASCRGYSTDEISPTRGIWMLSREDNPSREAELSYREALAYTLGIGQGAWSQIPGRVWYERAHDAFSRDRPIYKMRQRDLEVEAAEYTREWLIRTSFIKFGEFQEALGVDFRSHYGLELKILGMLGKIRIESDGVRFLPAALTERFFYGSVFFLRQWANLSAGKELLGPDFLSWLRDGLLERSS